MMKMSRSLAVVAAFSVGIVSLGSLYLGGVAGCGSSSSGGGGGGGSAGTAATTSGGNAIISTGSSTIGFIPSGAALIAVPLEGSAPGALTLKDSTCAAFPTPSFVLDSCGADGSPDLKVICVGFDSSKVAIFDVADFINSGACPTLVEVDLGTIPTSSSSGGSCQNCGVLADVGDHRFIVSSGDGYRVLNYADNTSSGPATVAQSFLSDISNITDPSNPDAKDPNDPSFVNLFTENFAFDAVNNRIISPEYENTNQYLWIADLGANKVYRWVKRLVPTAIDATNGLPELDAAGISTPIADAASIDVDTQILTISVEFQTAVITLNLHDISFSDSDLTFDIGDAHSAAVLQNVFSPGGGDLTTGQVIEPTAHLLFLEDEFEDAIGVVKLPGSASSGAVSGFADADYTSATIPDASATCPGVSTWSNEGDPHGLALFTSVADGRPQGVLINFEKSCAAIIDLQDFLSAGETSGTNQVADPTSFIHFVSLVP
jgi:hypothetical protein